MLLIIPKKLFAIHYSLFTVYCSLFTIHFFNKSFKLK